MDAYRNMYREWENTISYTVGLVMKKNGRKVHEE